MSEAERWGEGMRGGSGGGRLLDEGAEDMVVAQAPRCTRKDRSTV